MKEKSKAKDKLRQAAEEVLRSEFKRLLEADETAVLDRMRGPGGKIVLNSDDLFKVFPRYLENPAERIVLGPLLYPVARTFTDKTFQQLLSRPMEGSDDTVIFTSGGSATGKSTILRRAGKQPGVNFVVDTTLSDTDRALQQVEAALTANRKVEIHYVYRKFRESVFAMVERALDPESGRIVPVDDMARTHFGAQRAILAIIEKYQDDPALRSNSI